MEGEGGALSRKLQTLEWNCENMNGDGWWTYRNMRGEQERRETLVGANRNNKT
jgi:hypothetical protein